MPFANAGELRTHYSLTGSGRAVLMFSNSLGTDLNMWDPQMAHLSKDFRILRYDTRGHGQTAVPQGEYNVDQLGHDVLGLLDALGLDRVHFCGLSMGGMIGMWLGIAAPQRLNRLIVCSSAAKIGSNELWNARIASVRKDGMKQVAAAVVERWFTPEYRASNQDIVARTQKMLEAAPPEGYASCCAAVRDMDQRDAIAKIKVPTLVIYGSKDPAIPVKDALFLKEKIAGASAMELAAAHLSNVEQADAFTRTVGKFLSQ
jgi:3-oxoadipate enol-lactonase